MFFRALGSAVNFAGLVVSCNKIFVKCNLMPTILEVFSMFAFSDVLIAVPFYVFVLSFVNIIFIADFCFVEQFIR